MPNYTMRNKKTGKTKELTMTIAEMEKFEIDNPTWEAAIGAPLIADAGRIMGVIKPSEDFRDKIREIKKRHPLGSVNLR